jgi:hypothetical protein
MKRRFIYKLLIAACIICFVAGGVALAQSGGVFELRSATLDGGGGSSTGGAFVLSGTAGQADTGTLQGGDYTLRGGFWQPEGIKFLYLPFVLHQD